MITKPNVHDKTIFVYENALNASICSRLISAFDASDNTFLGVTAGGLSEVKKNSELYIDPQEAGWFALDEAIYSAYNHHVTDYFSHFPWLNIGFRDVGYFIKKYDKLSGYYDEHVDVSVRKNSSRILVGIIYLNDVDDGGETEFTTQGLRIQPKAGRMLLFPPMWMYPHKANIPKSNHKYTVNTFFVLND